MLPSINGVAGPYSNSFIASSIKKAGEEAMAGMPKGFERLASTASVEVPAIKINGIKSAADIIAEKNASMGIGQKAKVFVENIAYQAKEVLKTPKGKIGAAIAAVAAVVATAGTIMAVKNNEVKESKAEEQKLYALA